MAAAAAAAAGARRHGGEDVKLRIAIVNNDKVSCRSFAPAEVHLRGRPATLARLSLAPFVRAVQAQEVQAGMPPLVPHRPPG